jgi:hypothetical protein
LLQVVAVVAAMEVVVLEVIVLLFQANLQEVEVVLNPQLL